MEATSSTITQTEFMGCKFNDTTMHGAVQKILEWCTQPETSRTIVTVNASHLIMMRRDLELREACRKGDLVIADGVSVVWGSHLWGMPLKERIAGIDLMTRLLLEAEMKQLRIFLLGAKPHVLERLQRRLQAKHPRLEIAGQQHGYFRPEDEKDVLLRIRESQSHILFVGLPSPQKEIWCERHREEIGVPVLMGVGGSFDVLSGNIRRAPRSLQKLGLEWSWRLAMEPQKMWKRYLKTNTAFLYHLGVGAWRTRATATAKPNGM